jgi:hypothetical protein
MGINEMGRNPVVVPSSKKGFSNLEGLLRRAWSLASSPYALLNYESVTFVLRRLKVMGLLMFLINLEPR